MPTVELGSERQRLLVDALRRHAPIEDDSGKATAKLIGILVEKDGFTEFDSRNAVVSTLSDLERKYALVERDMNGFRTTRIDLTDLGREAELKLKHRAIRKLHYKPRGEDEAPPEPDAQAIDVTPMATSSSTATRPSTVVQAARRVDYAALADALLAKALQVTTRENTVRALKEREEKLEREVFDTKKELDTERQRFARLQSAYNAIVTERNQLLSQQNNAKYSLPSSRLGEQLSPEEKRQLEKLMRELPNQR